MKGVTYVARFWRKKPPSGEEVSEEYALGMQTMERWYHDFVIWAYSYISLLEKRLEQRDGAGCDQCKYRHDKSDDSDA